MSEAKVSGSIILEPCARNTAAAMALAALNAPSAEQLLLFCPADHHIPDVAAFAAMVRNACACAQQGAIVTFGVVPTFPSTGYGYIERGRCPCRRRLRASSASSKSPTRNARKSCLLAGKVLLERRHLPVHGRDASDRAWSSTRPTSWPGAARRWPPPQLGRQTSCARRPRPCEACRSREHRLRRDGAARDSVAVFPSTRLWSDVGSWNAVADMCPPDDDGNRIEGQGVAVNARNTFIHAPHRRVVALGTEDLIIVDTPDAVLVAHAIAAEQVKEVVAELEARGNPEARLPPQGAAALGLVRQHRRRASASRSSASWSSPSRFAQPAEALPPRRALDRGARARPRSPAARRPSCSPKTSPPTSRSGEVHRLHNPGKMPLEMIEVQSGSYLGEDDIVRLDDNYGRVVVPINDAKKSA